VGGGIGVAFTTDITEIGVTDGDGNSATISDVEGDDSFVYGLRIGHYLDSIPWLGVEANASSSTPDIDNQSAVVLTGTGAGALPSTMARVEAEVEHFTTVGLLVMLRPTKEQTKELYNIDPYLGIGFASNSINLSEAVAYNSAGALVGKSNLGSDSEVGIFLSAGLNYKVNDRTKLFTELRYTEASYDMTTEGTAYRFDVEGSSMMFGFSRTFDASPLFE